MMTTRQWGRRRLEKFSGFLVVGMMFIQPPSFAQQPGEQDYQTLCAACHTIGGGRIIGPDLIDIHERRSEEWLMEFVRSSQSMIESGDPDAVAIFEEYSNLLMPDPLLSEAQIADVLEYIQAASATDGGTAADIPTPAAVAQAAAQTPVAPPPPPSEADVLRGQDLFQGRIRFDNGGPTCNACHEVVNDAVIGGGVLSVELTTVFSRLGGPGVRAILGSSPFPVMQAAYDGRPLEDGEVASLVAFLQYADGESAFQTPRDYGRGLLISGLIGAAVLYVMFGLLWWRRKSGSVNDSIFERQIGSVWED